MRKVLPFFLISLFVLFLSCGKKEEEPKKVEEPVKTEATTQATTEAAAQDDIYSSPIKYNDYLIGYQNKIIQRIINLSKCFDKSDPKELDENYNLLVEEINNAIKAVNEVKPFKDDPELRDAVLNLFKFYEKSVANEFKEMITILKKGQKATKKDIERITELNAKITSEEKKFDQEFAKAQQSFSSKNGIQIKPNELQTEIDGMSK